MSINNQRYVNINYVMPFMFTNDLWILILNELFKEEKNPVKHIYGSVYSIWQSGRHAKVFTQNLNDIEQYLQKVVGMGFVPNFTFSSLNFDKDKLNDKFSNELLDIAYKCGSYFIVASDDLYKHIKNRYNDAKMICSVIVPSVRRTELFFNETNFYNKMLDKYEMVVLRPEYTMENIDKLHNLITDLSRVEVLINQTCYYNCTNHKKHYMLQEQTDFLLNKSEKDNEICIHTQENIQSFCPRYTIPQDKYRSVKMTIQQVDKLVDIGVKNFKLQGREGQIPNLIKDLSDYVIHQDISFDELKERINKIVSNIVLNNRALQYLYLVD